jgi:hypothetical protein
LGFIAAVFITQMSVRFYAQRTTVLMSKSARNRRNVHTSICVTHGK